MRSNTNFICPCCAARMQLKYVHVPSVGTCYRIACGNALCDVSGPLALNELAAAAKWLDFASGHDAASIHEEKTTVDRPRYIDRSEEKTTAVRYVLHPSPSSRRARQSSPAAPAVQSRREEGTLRLRPLPAFADTDPDARLCDVG